MKRLQQGFTLIELMISLILGLLVSAAALQILYTNSLSSNIQSAGSKIVDTNTFGLDYLTKQIRKANYGILSSQSFFLNHQTPQGGIVLTAPDNLTVFGNTVAGETVASNLRGLSKSNQQISDTLLTRSASSLSGSNVKFGSTALSSDQLTIQYKVSSDNQVDCQSRNVMKDDYVIERYFVRDGGLACASAIYTYSETTAKKDATNQNAINIDKYKKPIKQSDGSFNRDTSDTTQNLAGSGEIIIPNVDYFRVLLGVSDSKNFSTNPSTYKLTYMPIPTPITTVNADPFPTLNNRRIVNVQIGLLVRSDGSVTASKDPSFTVLDKTDIKLNDTSKNDGKMRRVLETTVFLRNARGTVQ
ncbi:Prepilin-type N-terminal cleavage/methylation domain-containing protein [Enhydrobacter sp. 8BJ]|nr:PilW family protein [Enhydrobacter sp. 8BJ]VXB01996.1 Prepilin-type N-terminal cleavage/methylation domain-containing protein [Enhydrobacter sp. 8BJ]